MELTTTLNELYKSILKDPSDDGIRLIYADALDDMENEESSKRAEFIRLQIEAYNLGLPPRKVTAAYGGRGPNHYYFRGDASENYKVGERIDLYGYKDPKQQRTKPGVLITRVDPDGDEGVEVTVKFDEYSKPYPLDQLALLRGRCQELFGKGFLTSPLLWMNAQPGNLGLRTEPLPSLLSVTFTTEQYHSSQVWGSLLLRWVRGFITVAQMDPTIWTPIGDNLIKAFPLSHVRFIGSFSVRGLRRHGNTVEAVLGQTPLSVSVDDINAWGNSQEANDDLPDRRVARVICHKRWPSIPPLNWLFDRNKRLRDLEFLWTMGGFHQQDLFGPQGGDEDDDDEYDPTGWTPES